MAVVSYMDTLVSGSHINPSRRVPPMFPIYQCFGNSPQSHTETKWLTNYRLPINMGKVLQVLFDQVLVSRCSIDFRSRQPHLRRG
jgi:hypothetical protein